MRRQTHLSHLPTSSLPVMSTTPAPRRSTRTTTRPEQFAEQQAAYALHEQEAALLRRVQQLSLEYDQPHSSDEETEADDDSSSS